MKTLVFCTMILAACSAFAVDAPKSTAPALTDQEKLQLREFELKDSQYSNQLVQLQQNQKDNAAAFAKWAGDKCKGKDGKQYQIDMNAAACSETPAEKK